MSNHLLCEEILPEPPLAQLKTMSSRMYERFYVSSQQRCPDAGVATGSGLLPPDTLVERSCCLPPGERPAKRGTQPLPTSPATFRLNLTLGNGASGGSGLGLTLLTAAHSRALQHSAAAAVLSVQKRTWPSAFPTSAAVPAPQSVPPTPPLPRRRRERLPQATQAVPGAARSAVPSLLPSAARHGAAAARDPLCESGGGRGDPRPHLSRGRLEWRQARATAATERGRPGRAGGAGRPRPAHPPRSPARPAALPAGGAAGWRAGLGHSRVRRVSSGGERGAARGSEAPRPRRRGAENGDGRAAHGRGALLGAEALRLLPGAGHREHPARLSEEAEEAAWGWTGRGPWRRRQQDPEQQQQ